MKAKFPQSRKFPLSGMHIHQHQENQKRFSDKNETSFSVKLVRNFHLIRQINKSYSCMAVRHETFTLSLFMSANKINRLKITNFILKSKSFLASRLQS